MANHTDTLARLLRESLGGPPDPAAARRAVRAVLRLELERRRRRVAVQRVAGVTALTVAAGVIVLLLWGRGPAQVAIHGDRAGAAKVAGAPDAAPGRRPCAPAPAPAPVAHPPATAPAA